MLWCWWLKLWDSITIAAWVFAVTYTGSVLLGEIKLILPKCNINQKKSWVLESVFPFQWVAAVLYHKNIKHLFDAGPWKYVTSQLISLTISKACCHFERAFLWWVTGGIAIKRAFHKWLRGSSESYRFPQYVLRPTEKSQLYISQWKKTPALYKPCAWICQGLGETKWWTRGNN